MNEWPDFYHYNLGLYETCLMVWSKEHRQLFDNPTDKYSGLRVEIRRLMERINE